jgi:hypothetical protein
MWAHSRGERTAQEEFHAPEYVAALRAEREGDFGLTADCHPFPGERRGGLRNAARLTARAGLLRYTQVIAGSTLSAVDALKRHCVAINWAGEPRLLARLCGGSRLAAPLRPTAPNRSGTSLQADGTTPSATRPLVSAMCDARVRSGGQPPPDPGRARAQVNDAVLALLRMSERHRRVLYLDLDVHHGDGVQDAFERSDSVTAARARKPPGQARDAMRPAAATAALD